MATAVLREVDDILEPLRLPGRADIEVPELDKADAGGPRTFMILGSDKREGVDPAARRGRTRSCWRAPIRTRTRSP